MTEIFQKVWALLLAAWGYMEVPIRWAASQMGIALNENYMFILVIAEIFLFIFVINLILSLLFTDISRVIPTGGSAYVRKLRRTKNYVGLGSYYADRGKNKLAVKWYLKAGAHKRAAEQALQGGNTKLAAKLYADNGMPELAAEIFENSGDWAQAAQYYDMSSNAGAAARAWKRSGQADASAVAVLRDLEDSVGVTEEQWEFADHLLTENSDEIKPRNRKALARRLAEHAPDEVDLTRLGELYDEAGMHQKAAEQFAKAGSITRAMRAYEQAGNDKGAAEMRGRKLERQGQYLDAAKEYEFAEAWVMAGQCYEQAEEYEKAAKCFEAVGEPMQAAEGYAANRSWDQAIRVLQAISPDHPDHFKSRVLLGRCFYEMGDYLHCAAALENELINKPVTRQNMNDFYMMAMAYEQLGRLEDARNVLYRIHTVDVMFKDVSHRISDIGSRISMEIQRGDRMPASGVLMAGEHGSGVVGGTPDPGGNSSPNVTHLSGPGGSGQSTRIMDSSDQIFAGRYRVEKELGRGGMGVVYKAHDTQLDRPVALKFLGTVTDDSRFLREARVAAKLIHPNIVAVYDFSGAEGQSYIAMEYIEGQGLSEYLKERGQLSPRESVNIVKQVCGALAAIHESGIVHRDIKPGNILMGKHGMVKLTDFGLAKGGELSHQITGSGLAVGTPAYMPPEQVLGKQADERTDIYALGLVLYECMLGREVFSGSDVLERQLNQMPPAPTEAGVKCVKELDEIILKCISKSPDDRYQSAEELRDALRNLRHE
ncbi:MAG: protein kinase [Xanthomonadales bacterium]|nr:protein kinase [Xanthomonadales bacterium]